MYVMFVVHQVGVDNHETVLVFWVLGFASCVHTTNLVDDDIANMVHCSYLLHGQIYAVAWGRDYLFTMYSPVGNDGLLSIYKYKISQIKQR